jgi:hypothetical protein
MQTDFVLCRLFADLVHTFLRVIVFHSNAAARPTGGRLPFLRGAEVAAHSQPLWPPPQQAPTPLGAMQRQRGAPQPPPRLSRAKRSCQSSIGYRRRRLPGCKTRGGGFTHGRAEASGHEGRCGGEGLGWGKGQGLGARAAGRASASARAGPAGPRCAGMREGRDARAGPNGSRCVGMREGRDARAGQRRAGMHEGKLRP